MGKTLGEILYEADMTTAIDSISTPWVTLSGSRKSSYEQAASAVHKAVLGEAIEAVRKIEDVTPADFKIGDGPFTKGDAWEAYYTGAIHTRTALIKALKSATNDREEK